MNGMYEDDSKGTILGFNETYYVPEQNKIVATSIRLSYQGTQLHTFVAKYLNTNTLKGGAVWLMWRSGGGNDYILPVQPDRRCVALLKAKIAEYEKQMAMIE